MRPCRIFGVARRAGANLVNRQQRRLSSEDDGDGDAGDHGRNAGSIRDAGGRFAEIGTSRENVYFRKVDSDLLQKMKERRMKEIEERQEEIKNHEKAIEEAKKELEELEENEENEPSQ